MNPPEKGLQWPRVMKRRKNSTPSFVLGGKSRLEWSKNGRTGCFGRTGKWRGAKGSRRKLAMVAGEVLIAGDGDDGCAYDWKEGRRLLTALLGLGILDHVKQNGKEGRPMGF